MKVRANVSGTVVLGLAGVLCLFGARPQRAFAGPAAHEGDAHERTALPGLEGANLEDFARLETELLSRWTDVRTTLSGEDARARAMVVEAKRLIVDAFPDDRARAERLLVDAIRAAPRLVEAYADLSRFVLWQVANGLKDPAEIQKATQLAAHVRELAPRRPLGNYLVCEILLALGQQAQAQKLYTDTAGTFPAHVDTKVFEARYFSDTDPSRALLAAQDALGRGHPMDDLSPAIALAVTTRAKQKIESVGEGLERFAAVYPDRWLWHRAAMAYAEDGKTRKARRAYERAVELGNTLESRLQLAVLEYTVLGEYRTASSHLEQVGAVLAAKPGGGVESSAVVLSHLSLALLEDGKDQDAARTARSALLSARGNSNVLVPLTEEFLRRKKGELVRTGLEEVARRDPTHEYVHITLANLATERKDLDSASDHFTAAIALAPARDDLLSARGHVAYRALRYDNALRDFERAAKLRPDQATHHYNKACMLSLLGRKDEALIALREAILLNGEMREIASRDTDLAPLREDDLFHAQLADLGVGKDAAGAASKGTAARGGETGRRPDPATADRDGGSDGFDRGAATVRVGTDEVD